MSYTRLSITATPGRNYPAFQPKDLWEPLSPRPDNGPFTEQSVTALPGQIHSFSAKDLWEPFEPRPDNGPFTDQSVTAVPGKRHSFLAKDLWEPLSPRPGGLYTALSVTALPGKRYSLLGEAAVKRITALQVYALPGKPQVFLAKTEVPVVEPVLPDEGGGGDERRASALELQNKLLREDQEVLEFIMTATGSGILEN